jgi:uncharacterized protein
MASEKKYRKRMPIILLVAAILLVLACVLVYVLVFQRPNPPLTTNTVTINGAVFNVEIASTSVAQARGLSFRPSLGENDGMLFVFASATIQNFWMKDMNFPLDMIWIGGGKVVGFAENAEPQPGVPLWSLKIYNSPDGTDKVLEVNAGTVAKDNIQVGDPVTIGGNY